MNEVDWIGDLRSTNKGWLERVQVFNAGRCDVKLELKRKDRRSLPKI
jgi:hypothetical protein